MFDYIRNNTRLMGILLALFIVPAFVLVGVDGYRNVAGRGEAVAVVAGQSIKRDEWDAAHRSEVDRMRASQPNVDTKLFDSDAVRYATLERLVRDKVLRVAAEKMNLLTSDQKLARDLQQNETIAGLRRTDGTLDMDRYRQLLAAQGLSPEMFEMQMRQDLSQRQVIQGVVASAVTPPAAAKSALQAFFERREVQITRLDTAAYLPKVSVTDSEVSDYYAANVGQFQAEEEADIEYLVLNHQAVLQGLTVRDADIASYYEQNAARYASKEERRASHILINAAAGAPAGERDAAKAKAGELLAQVSKAPATFAELARKHSQDPGSAPSGGDLGFFQRGAMVKPFEDAAFALTKGALSGVVESEFGYHVILVTDVKPSVARPLAQVKPEIEAELKKQMAQREFAEKADVFGNLVYEQATALAPVAEKLKLKVLTANGVKRTPTPALPPVLANEKLLTALFSSDSVDKKNNTEAVETGANQLVAARIVAHRPAHTLALDEVKPRVLALLKSKKAQALARQEGEKVLADGKAGGNVKLQPVTWVSRDKPQGLQPQELSAALRADTSNLPNWVGIDLGPQGYAVLKVIRQQERETPSAQQATQELRQYGQWWASAEGQAYYNLLKKRLKVEIKVPQPAGGPPKQG
jgi:peptidyl-prolyl cis-trans isomerase D